MTTWRPDLRHSDRLIAWADEWTNGTTLEPDDTDERWTTTRIRRAAACACSRIIGNHAPDMLDIATSGVGLAVAMDPNVPFHEAVAAGQRDLWDAMNAGAHHAGINRATGEPGPRFVAFWADWAQWTNLPEPTACESRITLAEVMAALPERHLDTLVLLAFADSMEQAAEISGITAHAFRIRVQRARQAALELWFDHDQAPALNRLPINRRGRNRTCPNGHLIAGGNSYRTFTNGRVREDCKACQDTSVNARRGLKRMAS